jgi:hypothetical protein
MVVVARGNVKVLSLGDVRVGDLSREDCHKDEISLAGWMATG